MKKEKCIIKMIKVSDIRIVSSRSREAVKYAEIVESIRTLGLKTPIVVAPRIGENGEAYYDLVCGEGRLNAYSASGAEMIPAHIIEADKEDLAIMSLVENFARSSTSKIGIIQEVQRLRKDGYNQIQIAGKLGYSTNHICQICKLIDGNKKKLLESVLRGKMKMTTAIVIAECSDDEQIQNALNEAYEKKELTMSNLRYVSNVIRHEDNRAASKTAKSRRNGVAFIEACKKDIKNGCRFIKRAEMSEKNLTFLRGAFGKILADECFISLMLSQKIGTIPEILTEETK